MGRVAAKQEHLENKETQNCLSGRPVHPQEPPVLRRCHLSSGGAIRPQEGPSVLGRSGPLAQGLEEAGSLIQCFLAGPQGTTLQHITCEAQNGLRGSAHSNMRQSFVLSFSPTLRTDIFRTEDGA